MKKIWWLLKAILVVIVLLFLAGIFIAQTLKPDYDGVKALPGLGAEVSVYFDSYGVPHIYGASEEDVFKALGYVHAQDRLWQMELLRRVGRGGLSEVFGPELVKTDRFFLALGIAETSRKAVAALDPNSPEVRMALAYLEGVNRFVDSGPTPVEFYLTGLKKSRFTLTDIHNTIGYMAFTFAMAHKTDPLLSTIKDSLGLAYVQDLEIGTDSLTTRIRNYLPLAEDPVSGGLADIVSVSLKDLPVPQFLGSNSWVLAPEKTRNGKVILANDPHIGFASPSVWYEAHLVAPGYEKYGFHLGGVPFPLLAHDRKLAYGLTMFENDDLNFYFEKPDPSDSTYYFSDGKREPFTYRTDTIRIKGADPELFTYRLTRNGPVMNDLADQIASSTPVSMSWVYNERENKLLSLLYGMSHAADLEDFQEQLPALHAPGLNVMYGDAEGNIAWWAAAHLNTLGDHINTKFILENPPADSATSFLDFTANPKALNPPWNYVYSANNQPEPVDGRVYPGYYLPENRARRIVEVLESNDDWDLKSVSAMMLDDTSPVNPEIVIALAKTMDISALEPNEIKLLDLLNRWKGNYPLESVAPTVFHRWIYYFLKDTFRDELGEGRFEQFLNTHFHKRMIAPMAAKDSSVWWDDTTTPGVVETRRDIVQGAFRKALESLEEELGEDSQYWTWDRVHQLEFEHPMGRVAALRSFFNIGPYPVRGSREVINNMAFTYREEIPHKIHSGPSTRRIIDFSDVENSLSILPTGQSGNPLSPHYQDQTSLYIHGKFRKMLMNKTEIQDKSESLLIFKTSN